MLKPAVYRRSLRGLALFLSSLLFPWLVQAQDPEPMPPALWLAQDPAAARIDLGTVGEPTVEPLLGTEGAQAVAVDAQRSRVWIWAGERLVALGASGQVQGALSVPTAPENGRLQIGGDTGTLWLSGSEDPVRALSPEGLELLALDAGSDVRDVLLAEATGKVWTASRDGISAWDIESGEEILSLELGEGWEPITLAAAREGGLWVAVGTPARTEPGEDSGDGRGEGESPEIAGEIRLYSANGELQASAAVAAPVALQRDGLGGVWFTASSELLRLATSREEAALLEVVTQSEPLGPDAQLHHLTSADSGSSIWVSGVERSPTEEGSESNNEERQTWRMARVDPGGFVHQVLELEPGLALRDLAVSSGEAETDPPELTFLAPEDGVVVETTRPQIRLSGTDTDSGLRWESLVLETESAALAIDCRPDLIGLEASCTLLEDLKEGGVTLSASVEDWAGNRSLPTDVSFRIEPPAPTTPPEPAPYAYFSPAVTDRGVKPNKVYQFDGVETVNPASGNLILRIPLGQEYGVGPLLSYQFALTHNSNVWQSIPISWPTGGESRSFSIPNVHSNAGIGWEFQFGKLYSWGQPSGLGVTRDPRWPTHGLPVHTWLYVAPDGATHTLVPPDANPLPAVAYSRDGSHLRMVKKTTPTGELEMHVEAPNGVKTIFRRTGERAGTQFCGGAITGCWRMHRLEDPFGNYVQVDYSTVGSQETWTINDSTGRSHRAVFDISVAGRGGGDGPANYSTAEGDEWGDLRRKLLRVEVATFQGNTSSYDMVYRNSQTQLLRGCPHSGELASAKYLSTWILDRVELPRSTSSQQQPDAAPYRIVTETGDESSFSHCSSLNGKVMELQLPTQGRLSYEYGLWHFPTRCYYRTDFPVLETQRGQYGIRKKHHMDRVGAILGTWEYEPKLKDPKLAQHEIQGVFCRRADLLKTTIWEPEVPGMPQTQRITFHSVSEGPMIPQETQSKTDWRVTDHGLPINKHQPTGPSGNPLFLSQKIYSCSTRSNCTLKREEYRRYAMDFVGGSKTGESPTPLTDFRRDTQLQATRTVYFDDGQKWVEREFSDYDGAGHFRTVTVRDSFAG